MTPIACFVLALPEFAAGYVWIVVYNQIAVSIVVGYSQDAIQFASVLALVIVWQLLYGLDSILITIQQFGIQKENDDCSLSETPPPPSSPLSSSSSSPEFEPRTPRYRSLGLKFTPPRLNHQEQAEKTLYELQKLNLPPTQFRSLNSYQTLPRVHGFRHYKSVKDRTTAPLQPVNENALDSEHFYPRSEAANDSNVPPLGFLTASSLTSSSENTDQPQAEPLPEPQQPQLAPTKKPKPSKRHNSRRESGRSASDSSPKLLNRPSPTLLTFNGKRTGRLGCRVRSAIRSFST